MVSNFFTIEMNQLDSFLSISPEYYREKQSNISRPAGIKISDLVYLINTTTSKKRRFESILLDTTNTSNGIINYNGSVIHSSELKTPKKIAIRGSVIISRLRPYLKQVGYIDKDLLEVYNVEEVMLSTEYYVMLPKSEEVSIAFLIPFLLSKNIQEILNRSVEGAHHPRFRSEVLLDLTVPQRILDEHEVISNSVLEYTKMYREFEILRRKVLENLE